MIAQGGCASDVAPVEGVLDNLPNSQISQMRIEEGIGSVGGYLPVGMCQWACASLCKISAMDTLSSSFVATTWIRSMQVTIKYYTKGKVILKHYPYLRINT